MENAENALILLYDLCRLCLDEPGVDNIFEPVDWSQDILIYTGIKVTSVDKLPQSICTSCRDIMNCVKILKEIATANEAQLKQISGLGDSNQVLVSESPSHLVIITPCTDNQNELGDGSAEPSSSVDQNFRRRIVFESEDETSTLYKAEKQSRKKKKSPTTERNTSKVISVRKDLFDSSTLVVSTKQRNESPSATSSPLKDRDDNKPSMKKCKQSPTTTNVPMKTVKVNGKEMKVHQYDFKCETCHKTYATYKSLYFHHLTHNKKFQCPLDVCCKKFASKGDLQKHIRSHTGEKPYKCDICDLSFTQNVTLRSHKKSIHSEPS